MERKFRINVNGTDYDVTVEELTPGSGRLLPTPGDMDVPPATSTQAPSASTPTPANIGEHDLPSPLAGVVESLAVQVGQAVNQGDPVAVLEAMKMKTTVVAHRDGEVRSLAVKAGDAVDAGQVLMTIR